MPRRPFLDVVVHDLASSPSITGLCVGYEHGSWRYGKLVKRLFEEVPNFALTYREREEFNDDAGAHLMGVAVRKIYTSDKYQRRGEFGELLLHMVLREVFGTEPAISKLFFKDAENDTVKGFDAVHVVVAPGSAELELWLGEVKFYGDRADAIRDVVAELHQHTQRNYLTSEFAMIASKMDPTWPHHNKLADLLDVDRTTLDEVIDVLTIPVLLTYDSKVVAARVEELGKLAPDESPSATLNRYQTDFAAEISLGLRKFCENQLPKRVKVRLILVPLHQKSTLVSALHERLKAWQQATA